MVTPTGEERPCSVALDLTHFSIRGCVDANRLWRLVPRITGLTTEQVPVGSRIMIEDADVAKVLELHPAEG